METLRRVLILVLVEHTLGEYVRNGVIDTLDSLNPCFSGTYSRSNNAQSIVVKAKTS